MTGSCSAPGAVWRPLFKGCLLALLVGCAGTPLPRESIRETIRETPAGVPAGLPEQIRVADLSARDAGLLRLAQLLAGQELVSIDPDYAGAPEDGRMPASLAEIMIERFGLRRIVLGAGCERVLPLEEFTSGRMRARSAWEVLADTDLPDELKIPALSDLMMRLRGWNAVYPEQPVRLHGIDCPSAAGDRAQVFFWGTPAADTKGPGRMVPVPDRHVHIEERALTGAADAETESYWTMPEGSGSDHILFMRAPAAPPAPTQPG